MFISDDGTEFALSNLGLFDNRPFQTLGVKMMTAGPNLNYYQRGLELAEAGRYQEALTCIEQYLQTAPDDAQALNDIGTILHCLGRSDEAINHLVQARSLRGDCVEIVWNLVEAYLAIGRAKEAMRLFDDMQRMDILNADVLNRTANVFLNQDNKADAIEVLLSSLQLWPNQEILKPMLEVIRSKRAKIAFFCGGDGTTFLNDIAEFTSQRFQVRFFEGQTEQELHELMKWSDISWFEWCTNLAVIGSKLPKVCKNIIRLHRYEAYQKWPSQVQWENIDVLITIGNPSVKDALVGQVPSIENLTRLITIANAVNLDRFCFTKKERGKNLASIGYLNMRKNPMFLLQCMQKLHYIDPTYKLYYAGSFQDPMLQQYVKYMVEALGLADVVFFDGWQQDIASWLKDKHYIVSTSIGEGVPTGILEAMACGLKPVIHNFPGAEQIFPSEFLFNISEEFYQQILSDSYEPERYRKFIEDNYSRREQLSKTNDVFKELEAKVHSQQSLVSTVSGLNVEFDQQKLH